MYGTEVMMQTNEAGITTSFWRRLKHNKEVGDGFNAKGKPGLSSWRGTYGWTPATPSQKIECIDGMNLLSNDAAARCDYKSCTRMPGVLWQHVRPNLSGMCILARRVTQSQIDLYNDEETGEGNPNIDAEPNDKAPNGATAGVPADNTAVCDNSNCATRCPTLLPSNPSAHMAHQEGSHTVSWGPCCTSGFMLLPCTGGLFRGNDGECTNVFPTAVERSEQTTKDVTLLTWSKFTSGVQSDCDLFTNRVTYMHRDGAPNGGGRRSTFHSETFLRQTGLGLDCIFMTTADIHAHHGTQQSCTSYRNVPQFKAQMEAKTRTQTCITVYVLPNNAWFAANMQPAYCVFLLTRLRCRKEDAKEHCSWNGHLVTCESKAIAAAAGFNNLFHTAV